MLMAIDVGNTNMTFTMYSGVTNLGSFRLMTSADRTSDEIGLSACNFFARFGLRPEDVEDVIISSVVPQVMYSLTNAILKYFDKIPLVVDDTIDPELPYAIVGVEERLGPDRAVACVAAIARYGTPLVVLDFGTATTVDAVDEAGHYLGGCITVGPKIATDALFSKTALLPRVELVRPSHVIGTNTIEQIQAGVVGGYIGSIEYLITETKKEMGRVDAKVIATGGLSRMVAENTTMIDAVDPQLVLDGLRILYQRHKKK